MIKQNLEFGYHPISPNYGYYIDKAPQNVLNELKKQLTVLQSNFDKGNKWNTELAGEIKHEYLIEPHPKTYRYIQGLAQRFENESQYITTNHPTLPTLSMEKMWVNFQKKHEYNPLHSHTGLLSFVIWYQIPYTFENEDKSSYKSTYQKSTLGRFSFLIPSRDDIVSCVLDIDKNKEGYVAIFPSNLHHIVYPFYSSDEYRITISSNIIAENSQ